MQFFKLFACCVPVRGARRSLICDLQRQLYKLIPNDLYEILVGHKDKSLEEIRLFYGQEAAATIDEYIDFLEENEFGFFTSEPERFPDLSLAWDSPSLITNAVLDVDDPAVMDFSLVARALDEVDCKALQVRLFRQTDFAVLEHLMQATSRGRLRHIEILLPYASLMTQLELQKLAIDYQRINGLYFYEAPQDEQRIDDLTGISVVLFRRPLLRHVCSVSTHPLDFVTNIDLFTESQHHHVCMNHKLCIGADLSLRNCVASKHSYGTLGQVELRSLVTSAAFKKHWGVHKNLVEVCKDCEFRFICTTSDCAAIEEHTGSELYPKPRACHYDPFTARFQSL